MLTPPNPYTAKKERQRHPLFTRRRLPPTFYKEDTPVQNTTLNLLLTSGVAVAAVTAIFKLIDEGLKWRRQRKAQAEDKAEAKAEKQDETAARLAAIERRLDGIEKQLDNQTISQRAILSDRIKHLGTAYINAGEVDFEERRNLHNLHSAYHNNCGGNGDFDLLMEAVDELPLKQH